MNKKLIKLCGFGLAGMLLVTGCTGGKTKSSAVKGEETPFGKYESPVTLNIGTTLDADVKFENGEDMENNVWTKLYEDELNVKLKYAWTVPAQAYDQKVSLVIASNDLPDVMYMGLNDAKKLLKSDVTHDMHPYFEKYASETVKKYANADSVKMKLVDEDGKWSSIPTFGQDIYSSAHLLNVRKDWLDKLGLELPKTLDDVMAAAKAIGNSDIDGKGKKVGLAANKDLYNTGVADLMGFFNGNHAYLNIWTKDENGKLQYSSIQPEVKDTLLKLNQMVNDGSLDAEFMVKDRWKLADEILAGKIGMYFGVGWAAGYAGQIMENDPSAEWVCLAIKSVDSKPALNQLTDDSAQSRGYYAVNKKFKNPEAVIKVLNLTTEMLCGSRKSEETYKTYSRIQTEDGELLTFKYAYIGATPSNYNVEKSDRVWNLMQNPNSTTNDPEDKITTEKALSWQSDKNPKGIGAYYAFAGDKSAFGILNKYKEDKQVVMNEYIGLPSENLARKMSILSQKQLEAFTKVILTGDGSVFDKYVNEWKGLGGTEMETEVNQWYQEYNK